MCDYCMNNPAILNDEISKQFDLIAPYVGNSAMDAECPYSDSELFVKRKDIDCFNANDADQMYTDYIKACINQKKYYIQNKSVENDDAYYRCPMFDFDTMRCVILGFLLTSKYAMVQNICCEWKNNIRDMFLEIGESIKNDEGSGDITTAHTLDDGGEWSERGVANDGDYLMVMDSLKQFDTFVEQVFKMNNMIMSDKMKAYVISKTIEKTIGIDSVKMECKGDGIYLSVEDGEDIVLYFKDVKDECYPQITNLMFLNKTH